MAKKNAPQSVLTYQTAKKAAEELRWRLEECKPSETLAVVAAWTTSNFNLTAEEEREFLTALRLKWGRTAMGYPIIETMDGTKDNGSGLERLA